MNGYIFHEEEMSERSRRRSRSGGGVTSRSSARSAAVALATLVAALLPADATHQEEPRRHVVEVGFHELLGTGFNTDVWAHPTADGRLFAYNGTWGTLEGFAEEDACPSIDDDPDDPRKSGIKIVDATDPATPRLAARIGQVPGSQSNDVKVLQMETAAFSGDVLVHSLEPCGVDGILAQLPGSPVSDPFVASLTGFELYDVTDPESPTHLGTYNNGGLGTHNLFPFVDDDGGVFVAAVYNEVVAGAFVFSEIQLVDITDPSAPQLVSTWDLFADDAPEDACHERGSHIALCILHDVWVDDGVAYLSWWDAGLILLDVSDPATPSFIGQALSQVEGDGVGWLDEEGDTHVAVPMRIGGRTLVVVGDEDFEGGIRYQAVTAVSPGAVAGDYLAIEWSGTEPLDEDGVSGELFYAGGGCTPADYAGAQPGFIALVDLRNCEDPPLVTVFQHKIAVAEAAGATALVLVHEEPLPGGSFALSQIPAVNVGVHHGAVLRNDAERGSLTGVSVRLHTNGPINPWGFMRVVDVTPSDPAEWRQVSTFRAPHVDEPLPGGIEDPEESPDQFSAHNPIVGPDGRVYFAWYSNGLRILDPLGASGKFKEAAWFAPSPDDHDDDLDADPHGAHADNVGFWGSFPIRHPTTGELLIFNSDINRGLYILKATGSAGAAERGRRRTA